MPLSSAAGNGIPEMKKAHVFSKPMSTDIAFNPISMFLTFTLVNAAYDVP